MEMRLLQHGNQRGYWIGHDTYQVYGEPDTYVEGGTTYYTVPRCPGCGSTKYWSCFDYDHPQLYEGRLSSPPTFCGACGHIEWMCRDCGVRLLPPPVEWDKLVAERRARGGCNPKLGAFTLEERRTTVWRAK